MASFSNGHLHVFAMPWFAFTLCDFSPLQSADLFVLLSSFLPKGGQILSVAVYPSEFGIQRMKEEEIHGPVGLFDDEDDRNEDDDDGEIDIEKLRAYEKSRLR